MNLVAFSPMQELEILIRQELEQKQFVLPLSIRCMVRQFKLLILLDYAAVESVETALDIQAIRHALSRLEPNRLTPLTPVTVSQVRCYWRQKGQQKPYKGWAFPFQENHTETIAISPGAVQTPPTPESQEHSQDVSNSQDLPKPQKSFKSKALLNVDGHINRDSEKTNTDARLNPRIGIGSGNNREWGGWRWLLGIGSIMASVAVGAGSYAWSRPCVSGDCILLEDAEALHASLAFEENTPVEDVSKTYSTLLEMNHQLSQVPFWSPHYEDVRILLTTYETHTHQVSKVLGAEEKAKVASAAMQAPPYPLHDWQEAQSYWQEAIRTLEPVSQDTIVSPLVKTQLRVYNTQLQAIEQNMEQEQEAVNQVRLARKLARRAEMDSSHSISSEQLKQVESYWQKALEHLETISEETMAYAEAAHLRAMYEPQLVTIRDRLSLETLAEESYRQAILSAKRSTTFEREQQWELAVTHWQKALEQINQVPEQTTYYGQAIPLVTSYATALTNAQDHLQKVMALQQSQEELANQCMALPLLCKTVTADSVLHVWLAIEPNTLGDTSNMIARTEPSATSVKLKNGTPILLEEQAPSTLTHDIFNSWIGTISTTGQTMQVSIHVYNPDGSVFGTYTPETSRFIRTPMVLATPDPQLVNEVNDDTSIN